MLITMQPSGRGYDSSVGTFSPDGRLHQVEYARESVKRGSTTVGVKFRDGVILIVAKRIPSKLVIPESIEKMYKIDDHIGITTSGLVADARQLVDRARVQCQINKMTYGDSIDVTNLVKKMCDYKQSFTQYGGARPFGTALLIAGVDSDGPHLYETDPSGAYGSYQAGAIGSGRSEVISYFEEKCKPEMTENASIKIGLEALSKTFEDGLSEESVESCVINSEGYRELTATDLEKHISKL